MAVFRYLLGRASGQCQLEQILLIRVTMGPVLQRPRHPLPRKFRRPVNPRTRTFARRRHARSMGRSLERLRRARRRFELAARTTVHWIRRYGLIVASTLLVLVMASLLVTPVFEVRQIRVKRSQSRVEVQKVVEALSPLYRRRLPFLQSHEAVDLLKSVVPDLESVVVSKDYPHQLTVSINVQPLVAMLDIATSATATSPAPRPAASPEERSYDYLTANGVYVTAPQSQSGTVLPTIRIVDWAVKPVPGTILLTPEVQQKLKDISGGLQEQFNQKTGVPTVYLRAREVHVNVGKVNLWFDLHSPLDEQMERYRLFLATVAPGEVKQYVDLRLRGKVVWR